MNPVQSSIEPLVVREEHRGIRNLVDLVHRSVERYPDREALRWKRPKVRRDEGAESGEPVWESRTYREMWEWITELSLGLENLGIGAGDAVCIIGRTRPQWAVADLASLALGAVTAPIYPTSAPNQAAFIIRNVKARLVFVENAQQAAKIESIRGDCPSVEHVVAMEARGTLPDGTLTLEDVAARANPDAAKADRWREGWRAIGRDQLATVTHTSGTTADPKGAMLTHGNIVFNFEAATMIIPSLYPTDVILGWLPLSHVYGRLTDEFLGLGIGATIAYGDPIIERLPQNMLDIRPTLMAGSPRVYEVVYARVLAKVEAGSPIQQRIFHWAFGLGAQKYQNHLDGKPDAAWLKLRLKLADRLVFGKIRARTGGRVRYFVSGAAPLAREIGEFFYAMGMLVLEGYGLTETSPFVSVNRPDDFVFGTVGRPAPGSQVRIDPASSEILVRGPQVMQGYLNDPEETSKAIDPDGWFHTGDIGELDEGGRIRITDRLKNIIVLANGKNVSPGPMEAALTAAKFISQALIFGEGQSYTGALVAPDFEQLGPWAAEQGLAEMPPEQLVEQPVVRRLIDGEVKQALAGYGIHERPRRVAILPRALTEEAGEITPSFKIKQRVVQQNWSGKIAYLFDEMEASASPESAADRQPVPTA
jgi:long-chain acyl-CoA synthetase